MSIVKPFSKKTFFELQMGERLFVGQKIFTQLQKHTNMKKEDKD